MSSGYCITTKCFTLKCGHPEWLGYTQELYNQVLHFYYRLLLDHKDLLAAGSQKCLRGLETLSIVGREKASVPYPLPFYPVPLYFRRAAINAAIAMVKSLQNRNGYVNQASSFHASVVYYKGMYKELKQTSISLKVYNGEKWCWMKCRISGNEIGSGEAMSPFVVIRQSSVSLHIPVKEEVRDIRKAKERMSAGDNICCVQFTNTDSFAVACIMDENMEQKAVRFMKGGSEYSHLCTLALKNIVNSEHARGETRIEGEKTNRKYWMYLKHVSEYYAHQISREIVDFSVKNQASTIVIAKSMEKLSKPVLKSAGNWTPLHLSTRIKEYMCYKAWKSGVIVLEVQPGNAAKTCAICGASVKKKDTRYLCEQGHTGNRFLNTARNLGKICIRDFQAKR